MTWRRSRRIEKIIGHVVSSTLYIYFRDVIAGSMVTSGNVFGTGEKVMLRKTMIALFAMASVAMLTPDVASARGGFGGGGFHGGGFGGGGFHGGGFHGGGFGGGGFHGGGFRGSAFHGGSGFRGGRFAGGGFHGGGFRGGRFGGRNWGGNWRHHGFSNDVFIGGFGFPG